MKKMMGMSMGGKMAGKASMINSAAARQPSRQSGNMPAPASPPKGKKASNPNTTGGFMKKQSLGAACSHLRGMSK